MWSYRSVCWLKPRSILTSLLMFSRAQLLSPQLFILCVFIWLTLIYSPHKSWHFCIHVMWYLPGTITLDSNIRQNKMAETGMCLKVQKTEYQECGTQTVDTININKKDFAIIIPDISFVVISISDATSDMQKRVNAVWLKWRHVSLSSVIKRCQNTSRQWFIRLTWRFIR